MKFAFEPGKPLPLDEVFFVDQGLDAESQKPMDQMSPQELIAKSLHARSVKEMLMHIATHLTALIDAVCFGTIYADSDGENPPDPNKSLSNELIEAIQPKIMELYRLAGIFAIIADGRAKLSVENGVLMAQFATDEEYAVKMEKTNNSVVKQVKDLLVNRTVGKKDNPKDPKVN